MLKRFLNLRKRFIANALELGGTTGPVPDARGKTLARIDTILWKNQKLTVTGHSPLDEIGLRLGKLEVTTQVQQPDGQFRLVLLVPLSLHTSTPAPHLILPGQDPVPLSLFSMRLARIRLSVRLIWLLLVLLPDIYKWHRQQNLQSRHRIKTTLGFEDRASFGPLDPALLTPVQPVQPVQLDTPGVVIILPVHNAFDVLVDCLQRVSRNSDLPWTLIAIDDASSDPRISPLLHGFAADHPSGQVQVLELESNHGFIGAVNTAFAHIEDRPELHNRPVILLNSDALVPPRWVSRLVQPMLTIPNVASVTPMSNDAEIFTVPTICARNDPTPAQIAAIDALASRLP